MSAGRINPFVLRINPAYRLFVIKRTSVEVTTRMVEIITEMTDPILIIIGRLFAL